MDPERSNMEPAEFTSVKRSRSAHLAQLTKLYNELERQMISVENVAKVKQLYDNLCDRFENFKTTHLQCLDLCDDTSYIETLETNYSSQQNNFAEFNERYTEWKKQLEACPDDNVSIISSGSSARSSRAQLRNAKAKRLIAEQKLRTLREKQKIEREQRELENKRQMLEQESELEQAKIEESVLNEMTEDSEEVTPELPPQLPVDGRRFISGGSCDVSMATDGKGSRTVINDNMNSNGKIENLTPTLGVNNIDEAFHRLASTLQEGFNLPKPELLTFTGRSIDYCKFVKNFETNIEAKISDSRLRLSYLIQYCVGEAKSCIEDCVLLDPEDGYRRAREILQNRYGKPHVIARSYIDRLVYGPQVKASDVEGLSQLALEMQKCEITLSQLGFVSDVDKSENLRRIVKRLPMHLRTKWVDIAHAILESGREPRFSDLAKFVDDKSRVACSMYGIDLVKDGTQSKVDKPSNDKPDSYFRSKVTTLTTRTGNENHKYERKCYCCSGTCINLSLCKEFKSMHLGERRKFAQKFKLCFNCLKGKHMSNTCRKPKQCTVPDCTSKHHTLLHSWVRSGSDDTVTQPSVNCAATNKSFVKTCLGIIPVTVVGGNGNSCQTYALLDDGADKTLCDERLLQTLNVPGKPVTFKISTVSSTGSSTKGQEVDLQVRPVSGDGEVNLNKVWSVKRLPVTVRSAATAKDIHRIPYLTDLPVPCVDASDVMLLIGTDSPNAHIPLEVRSGNSNQPYAVRTRLGWTVRGPVPEVHDPKSRDSANVNFGQFSDVMLQQQLERMWTSDFDDVKHYEKDSLSVEDKRALCAMESTLSHENGHYKMGLPWRKDNTCLPNNLALAHARLNQLKRKLSRDTALHEKYTATVTDYIEKGYAKEVKAIESTNPIWYLPHHPVTNENKPGKVRVVFDCAAKFQGISLNSQLLQGPDLMNSLVGVLIRFRQEKIALVADIEAMFHQVQVCEKDCDALRFLWWPGGDMSITPKTYCMKVHLFGATSSPSCAAYALKRTATDNIDRFEPEVISTVNRNFYVDDCLKSIATEEKAVKLANDLQSLMRLGGFRLTKWLSNSRTVLDAIPEAERAPSVVKLEPGDSLPNDRALGVIWNVNDDTINFKVTLADKPMTRRGILSVVSSIFDPLGLVSPVTLRAKAIVQDLCREKIGWDDKVPQGHCDRWKRWLASLPHLENIVVSRCFRPTYFGKLKSTQLHIFSDGSELGYGACAYLRMVDENDNITSVLVLGKSRLAPIKQISIPRLELSGAVVACRVYAMLSEELDMKIDQTIFWTDSTILLGYINNVTRRFKTFVGNRLSVIHEITSPEQWRHIDSSSNPADIASRGIDPSDTRGLQTWLRGPEFLLQDPATWPILPSVPEVANDDTEVKKEAEVYTTTTKTTKFDDMFTRYSEWTKLQRAFAWIQRFKTYCRRRYLKHDVQIQTGEFTVAEIWNATRAILQIVQKMNFLDELTALRKCNPVKTDSRIAPLNPILCDDLIRVYGRQQRDSSDKCPVILSNNSHVTTLIIRHYHKINGHVGIQQVLAATREKYWILRGPSTIKKAIGSCFVCRRQRSPLLTQQMAPLMSEQLTPDKPPFTFVGVDYFGPLLVKSGRSHLKRYGCLFTCLTTRAVHIEISHSLTTDSFIAALQRFTSRRGTPDKIYSDNGTNLVSGDRELRKSIQEWNQSKIGQYMLHHGIEWYFNPPYASHRGGAWERLIRSTRAILKATAREQLLTDEKFVTLMTEAERIMNDRPITQVSNDPNDLMALTPSMLLLFKTNSSIPRGVFKKEDVYSKRWWRQIHYLTDVFWRRWIREYLPSLQLRQKWQRAKTNLREGDVVLVADDNVPRGQWPLGRVTDVIRGRDGNVRSCVVRSCNSLGTKPITKLCLLESSE